MTVATTRTNEIIFSHLSTLSPFVVLQTREEFNFKKFLFSAEIQSWSTTVIMNIVPAIEYKMNLNNKGIIPPKNLCFQYIFK